MTLPRLPQFRCSIGPGDTHPMMSFHNKAGRQLIGGLAQELVDHLVVRGASPGHIPDSITYNSTLTPLNAEAMKVELDNMDTMVTEAGVQVLFHTLLVDVQCSGSRIGALVLANRGGLSTVEAQVFVDATGDADLAARPDNLLLTGRAISADHEGAGAIRVTPIAMALGQAAGTLGAVAVRRRLPPTACPYTEVREVLWAQGALLPDASRQ